MYLNIALGLLCILSVLGLGVTVLAALLAFSEIPPSKRKRR